MTDVSRLILPVFMYRREDEGVFVVIQAASFEYGSEWTGWMEIAELGEWSLDPKIDEIGQVFVFDSDDAFQNEQAALRKVAQLYAEQL